MGLMIRITSPVEEGFQLSIGVESIESAHPSMIGDPELISFIETANLTTRCHGRLYILGLSNLIRLGEMRNASIAPLDSV
jgi:hypothetical protein